MNSKIDYLLESIPGQRWFGGKGRTLAGIEIVDEAVLVDGPPGVMLTLVSLLFTDGDRNLYQMPLLVDEDGSARDATDDPARLAVVGDLMAHAHSVKGTNGVFHFGGAGLDPLSPPPGAGSVRVVGTEQSNTSIVLDDSVILKLFRRLDFGPNPDLELNRLLTNEGFEHVPAQVGEIVYEGQVGDLDASIDLGIAQAFVADATDGWEEALRHLRRLFDEIDPADANEDIAFLTAERAKEILDSLAELGDVTASLHVALSHDESDPDLVAAPIESEDLDEWAQRIEDSLRSEHAALKGLEESIRYSMQELRDVPSPGLKTRVHGDYHLGQVLLGPRTWMIMDFEGEPLRSLEERRAKHSPLKDVAGMLRSFSYAASAVTFERAAPGSAEWRRLEPWADTWETLARERFLSSYLTRAHEGRFLPPERESLVTMLDAFEIEKALYEVSYERSHRPEWVQIPRRGIAQIAQRTGVVR